MKITAETKFEIIHFEGEHPNETLWSYHSIKVSDKWCAGTSGASLLVTDKKELAARFANEHTASEFIEHIKKVALEVKSA